MENSFWKEGSQQLAKMVKIYWTKQIEIPVKGIEIHNWFLKANPGQDVSQR